MRLSERITLFACSMVMVLVGYATIVMGVTAPAIVTDVGIALGDLGIVFSSVAVGGTVGAMIVHRVEGLFGKKIVLILSLLLMAGGLFLSIPAASIEAFVLARIVTGFGMGLATPIAMVTAGGIAIPGKSARASSIVAAGAPAGTFATGVIGGLVLQSTGWEALFFWGALLCLLIAMLIACFYPKDLQAPGEPKPSRSATGASGGLRELIRSDRSTAAILLPIALGSSIALYVIGSWLPMVLIGRNMSIQTSNWALALFTLGGSLGALLLGRGLGHARPGVVIAAAYLFGAIGIVAMLATGAVTAFIFFFALWAGLGAYGAHMSLFSFINLVYQEHLQVVAQGTLVVIFRIGGFLGPLAAGALIWAGAQLGQIMVAAAIFLAVTGILIGFLGFKMSKPQE